MRTLEEFHNREFVEKQLKLQTMRTLKVKAQVSIETQIFSVLQEIGVELSSFRERSLNGRDIKRWVLQAWGWPKNFDCKILRVYQCQLLYIC